MQKIDLTGKWLLHQKQKPNEKIPIEIPCDNITALLRADKIPDPYVGTNELDVQWIGKSDWVFTRYFEVSASIFQEKKVILHFDSIDTISKVYVNDQLVGRTENMFRSYAFEIQNYLVEGDNVLTVKIQSAENAAHEIHDMLPYAYPHSINPVQSMHRNLVRKVQCHSGWDWAPCLMVSGIYGKVELHAYSVGKIIHVHSTQKKVTYNTWEVEVFVDIKATEYAQSKVRVSLEDQHKQEEVNLQQGTNLVSTTFIIKNPDLWWPNGYGTQVLYPLTVQFEDQIIKKHIGFRTIEVITEKDPYGESFKFRVNGKDIFCKGANWIPIDALPARQTKDRYKKLLRDVQTANMNMLRVWGGGQYEKDIFYDLCDELGILVWQDFMFACSLYPNTPEFLINVEQEVIYQVKRLKNHPCIALWCGDNENIGALTWFEITRENFERYRKDYEILNKRIAYQVKRLDPTRKWWPSSPSAGEGDFTDNWHNDSRGDMHYWSVWHEGEPFESYYLVKPRFCSEFGFQSLPSFSTVKSFTTNKKHWAISSKVMNHHQRHPNGNKIIEDMFERYFRPPKSFKHALYLSQVQQAKAIKMAVEYWRSCKPIVMGTLYWQLNDTWPVASWSSIEYSGKWKPLHYVIKRVYEPIILAIFSKDDKNIQIWGINDSVDQLLAGKMILTFMDYSGTVYRKYQQQVRLKSNSKNLFTSLNRQNFPLDPEEGFLLIEVVQDEEIILQEAFLLTKPKDSYLEQPNVEVEIKEKTEGKIEIILSTDKPAFYVTLDSQNCNFSDNCFTLLPKQEKVVRVRSDVSLEELQKALEIYHLRTTYD